MHVRLSLTTALTVTLLLVAAVAAYAQRTPLRNVDWDTVVRSEPQISLPPDCPLFPFTPGPCIEVQADASALPPDLPGFADAGGLGPVTIAGYADTFPEDIVYGDLDGDGTAGTIGFLIFREGEGRPALVTAVDGYKVYPQIENGRVAVRQPYYFGFEGNCCPTGAVQLYYTLAGNELRFEEVPGESPRWLILGEEGEQPATLAELVVAGFYRAIAGGQFDAAYDFLSPAYQIAHPFPEWQAGFATTRDVQVETRPAGGVENGQPVPGVFVTLTVQDELPSGEVVTRRFAGTWRLTPSTQPGLPLWLDRGLIEPVP